VLFQQYLMADKNLRLRHAQNGGTRLLASQHVNYAGVYEVRLASNMLRAIEEFGRRYGGGKKLKAGGSGGILLPM